MVIHSCFLIKNHLIAYCAIVLKNFCSISKIYSFFANNSVKDFDVIRQKRK